MSLKLLRETRLRKRALFRKVYEEGRFVANHMLAVHFIPQLGHSRRIGFSAGKRLGNAVVRNRCKRRLRECYRLHQFEVPLGMDMIVVARRDLVNAKWEKIVSAFLDAIRRSRTVMEKSGSGK
jgi:ribonuclease P protein component